MLDEIKSVYRKKDPSEFKKFGITMGVFFLLVGLVGLAWNENSIGYYMVATGTLLLSLGLLVPLWLRPFFVLWMSMAVILGFVMTRIILTAVFYLIFTPVGLVLRLMKKDVLDQKIDVGAKSYWKVRTPAPYDPKSTERQY